MAAYSFVTRWRFKAALDKVWTALDQAERYSDWWPATVEYRDLTPGVHGVGSRAERVVKGRLPYSLRYTTTVTRYEPPREVAYDAIGELIGVGRFALQENGEGTDVAFYWDVQTSGFWMNVLAPVLKPLFAWNHNWVMKQGERGLAQKLASEQVQADIT
jgi:hypothetical protein